MWKSILDWIKGLFGGKGSMQIGKDNVSASGSTAGASSPVVSARGDVYLTISPEREPSELFNLVLQEFNAVKEVLKRGIDSTELRQKKKVARHLFETCKAWSCILCETFDAAAAK